MKKERNSVQVPVDIFDDLFYLFMLKDFTPNPENRKKAIIRVMNFLRDKKERDVRHEYYSEQGKMPNDDEIDEMVNLYTAYLKLRRG